jgi:hypothetical protein
MSAKKEYMRLYYLKNKEKYKQYKLANKDKIEQYKNEYDRLYYLANKAKIAKKKKEYQLANKDKIAKKKKEYYLNNKDKIKQYQKEYQQTEAGKKSSRICHWKKYGIKDHYNDNYETIYKIYSVQKNCSVCSKVFNKTNKMDYKCIDHCHLTGKMRRICCFYCNLHVVK